MRLAQKKSNCRESSGHGQPFVPRAGRLGVLIFAPQLFRTHYSGIHLPWIIGSYLFLPVAPPGGSISPVIGVGWTLNYEMFFYAIFAGALLLPMRLGLQLICLCFGSLVALGTLLKSSNPLLYFVTNWLLLDFLMGVAIAWWVLTKGKLSRAPRFILFSIGVVCLTATIVWTPPEEGPLRFLLWGIPTALIVVATCSASESERSLGRITTVLGDAFYQFIFFSFLHSRLWRTRCEPSGRKRLHSTRTY
jgi:exopolysaccharide production protein ExoZ